MVGGATLEITSAQFWSSAGDSSLEQEVEFHSVVADPASVFIDGTAGEYFSRLAKVPGYSAPGSMMRSLRLMARIVLLDALLCTLPLGTPAQT